jgi:two-component system OmpR family sensor kinase
MTAWNASWRFPLYLRIWIAVIVTVGLLTVAFGWLWRLNTEEVPMREVIIRNEADEVLGQSMVRPNRIPGQGLEFDVLMKDGRTLTVQLPPRQRGPGDRGRPFCCRAAPLVFSGCWASSRSPWPWAASRSCGV